MIEFIKEFWSFLRERKKFWLLPIVLVLLLVGSLLVLAQGSAIAPFIYTLF
jgi:competence protein ComGC